MNPAGSQLLHDEDRRALEVLRAYGYQVQDIQEIARDQRSFAVRLPARRQVLAPGVHFASETVELGGGAFTNAHTLRLHLDSVRVEAVSDADGFHLRDQCAADCVVAAVNGSFSYVSDDPAHQPAEPCLDFCCRAGTTVSLPTVTKPALLVHGGRPTVRTLPATGTLRIDGCLFDWVGSKEPGASAAIGNGTLAVFGAANCRIRYEDHPRTGFIRFVRAEENITPKAGAVVDAVVSRTAAGSHVISGVHPGGGADLFAGSFVLRADAADARELRAGAQVEICSIAGLAAGQLSSGVSLGPSVADAAAGTVPAYDESLGVSPFRDVRYARTLVWTTERAIIFRIFDGAPLTDSFRGVSPTEVADLLDREGISLRDAYHLDGGQSSKIAFCDSGRTEVVGNLHYLKWPQEPETAFRWRGVEGRLLNSCFVLRRR
ncbi:phosphodiester glycosidase family protein [Streptomyces sp. NPDC046197]|uniref:phosphodiester glycosidase family protein n=1 Tax=Streptomyces sp. NPDC046197 TaxID=3154337 RepID=UPI00340AA3A8